MLVFAGFVDDICLVQADTRPVIIGLFFGDVCVVTDSQQCDRVQIIAENFAVNSMFACKIVVCVR